MYQHPGHLKYTATHEWLRDEGSGLVTVGITDHAQSVLGEVVCVELPESGVDVGQGEDIAVVESVKTAADVYSPLNGTIEAVNEQLVVDPGLLNRDPYGDGWLYQIRMSDEAQFEALLDVADYENDLGD